MQTRASDIRRRALAKANDQRCVRQIEWRGEEKIGGACKTDAAEDHEKSEFPPEERLNGVTKRWLRDHHALSSAGGKFRSRQLQAQ
jgi:hypothetical protein